MVSLANSNIIISDDFKSTVEAIAYSANMEQYCAEILKAEKMAIETKNLIPICHLLNKYICNSTIYDRLRFINGTFDFVINQ